MKKMQISTTVSEKTRKQAEKLMKKFGYTLRDIVSVAIDRMYQQEIQKRNNENDKLKDKLTAAEKIFSHFGGLSELMKWENAQGETAANVIQEYLDLTAVKGGE